VCRAPFLPFSLYYSGAVNSTSFMEFGGGMMTDLVSRRRIAWNFEAILYFEFSM
jgi:hypothetical protein